MAPTLLIIEHVPHERLGVFEPAFTAAGCSLLRLTAHDRAIRWPSLDAVDGIVSMGGPMSVYQQAQHPFLAKEVSLLREAIKRQKPILGICLGAQLVAAALGARVTKNPQKEIGWYPLMREPAAEGDPLCQPFGQTETVFQWHGDTFALPKGAVRLFSSPLCREQAFRYYGNVYGLQFHLEVTEAMIRAWMQHPANRTELASLKGQIDPMTIRRQSPQHIERLGELALHVTSTFSQITTQSKIQNPKSKIRPSPEAFPHASS